MRLFFADLLMMLGAMSGLFAIPWTPYAPWGLALGAVLATAGLALDRQNVARRVACLGCAAIGWQVPGLLLAAVLLPTAFALRIRGRAIERQPDVR